ncbi:hypothetical protein AL1_21680 [Alistipes shahii WAL 8301]|uniref:Uncharacterized protein n=1 Tax=Alistipes shahii WAL 8301 TaxID=717959 RepID=D4INE7_9BACT|nr:hypothetical protein AL1_21680 [Alistipes shahii WAL 8301]
MKKFPYSYTQLFCFVKCFILNPIRTRDAASDFGG